MNLFHKSIKICLFLVFISNVSFSQQTKDSLTYKRVFGLSLSFGVNQRNFNSIRQYPYLLNKPSNFSVKDVISIYVGNPDKFFIAPHFGMSFGRNKTGSYNSENVNASGEQFLLGALATYKVYNKPNKKIKGIYTSLGASYSFATVYSYYKKTGKTGLDTSVYFENCRIENFLIQTEIMFEFFDMNRKNPYSKGWNTPFILKAGYCFQLKHPSTFHSQQILQASSIDYSNVKLGGFYLTVGYNLWIPKKKWVEK